MTIKGVILVNPQKTPNLGSIARSMISFGVNDLFMINPSKWIDFDKAKGISKQGCKIIENAKMIESINQLKGIKVATISEQDNKKYGFKLKELNKYSFPKKDYYIVMGRESNGLTKEELLECDELITIKTNGKYGVLNLSTATSIMLFKATLNGIKPIL